MQDYKEWLAGLKVGDEVTTGRGLGPDAQPIYRIDGETPTRWKVGGDQFRKDDGQLVGVGKGRWEVFQMRSIAPPLPIDRTYPALVHLRNSLQRAMGAVRDHKRAEGLDWDALNAVLAKVHAAMHEEPLAELTRQKDN